MKKFNSIKSVPALCFCLLISWAAQAQLTLTGQVRTRTEYRDGLGTLRPAAYKPAFFTSQRSRITMNYKWSRVTFQASLQDVRVWGQDASSISSADGSRLGLHEAWADVVLFNKKDSSINHSPVDLLSVKIGRQELLYDDSRLLGNLDWLQQARRHDAIVFKVVQSGWQIDAGASFSQNTDAFNYNGTFYTPANVPAYIKDSKGNLVPTPGGLIPIVNASGVSAKSGNLSLVNPPGTNGINQQYKALQFVYAAKSFHRFRLSALFLTDQFSKYRIDSVQTLAGNDPAYVYGRRYNQAGVNTRFTTGVLTTTQINKKKTLSVIAGGYYQGGKDKEGLSMAAFTSTLSLTYAPKKWAYTIGWDYVSGNDAFSTSATNHRFDPLYGTPHKFWGYMDYFYVGTGSPTGGLSDPYIKLKYSSASKRFTAGLDYHYFLLAKDQQDNTGNAIDKYLGSEFDFTGTYMLNKITQLELGISYMAATESMAYAKNVSPATVKKQAGWAYLQVNIRPEFLIK